MKFIGIVGTNSATSTNRKLLQFMQQHFAGKVELEICEIKDLPAFNEPEDHAVPTAVQALSAKIEAADGVIISTPEYDHAIPAALKSALEWLSYTTRPLIDKPVMIVGASHGSLGSSRAQAHLRQILDAPELKARIMPSSEFLLGRSLSAFDGQGNLLYPEKMLELEECFDEFMLFVKMINQLKANHHFTTDRNKKFTWEHAAEGGNC
ncbi:NAD(P)H-dependent FMN reductase [Enterococcus sp. PF1-24]|uniref:NADPH-dependent FMN reductase n=1 Tax=unclassified Enterococcus TaxID=2608891 RepID=UPI0024739132|nr:MULTISPECIES: NADPH-dependent FMN reductase [unclassified Enterococcus]MDH6363893.1 NAD(P)H-dependent FMN reductase [Enterococcus sp. PFB1-1]MDH6400921.1 NAD(P)H-dependent FMN reductase [Enterococcus sp. PF1-24]